MDIPITINADETEATISISEFTSETYRWFLEAKKLPRYDITTIDDEWQITFPAEYAKRLGGEEVAISRDLPLPLPEFIFDRQEVGIKVCWKKRRYALFWDAGLGKTLVFLELARQLDALGKKCLIVSPLNVITQTIETAMEFYSQEYPHIINLHGRKAHYDGIGPNSLEEFVKDSKYNIAIINHDAFRKPVNLSGIDAVFLDESSILKNPNGTLRTNLINSCKGIPYKYAFSATQAPNERVEYAQIATWLEVVRSDTEFIGMFFVQKGADKGGWVLRHHRVRGFYDNLASWSMFMRDPAVYGLENNLDLKPYQEIQEHIEMTREQLDLIRKSTNQVQMSLPGMPTAPSGFSERGVYNQVSKGFLYDENRKAKRIKSNKPLAIRKFILEHQPRQTIIWTVYDEEGEILFDDLTQHTDLSVACLTGKTPMDERNKLIERFRHGHINVMITKPKLLGLGLNLHNASICVFSGLADSWEAYYQALKREWRFPQRQQVLVYLPYTSHEKAILQNVLRKRDQAEHDFARQEKLYAESGYYELEEYLSADVKPARKETKEMLEPVKTDKYELYHTDSIEATLNGFKKESVDLIVTSIPFRNDLFAYTDHVGDMGNSGGVGEAGRTEFMMHLMYCLKGMYNVLKPGRLACIEISQSPLRLGVDGVIGVSDFRGDVIRCAEEMGFIQFGDIPVLENPQAAAIVKHITTLDMNFVRGDRTRLSPMFPDFIITLKKPGENQVPVTSDEVHNENWIEWADCLWQPDDYNESNTQMTAVKQKDRWESHFKKTLAEFGKVRAFVHEIDSRIERGDLTELEFAQMLEGAFYDIQQSDTLNTPFTRGRTKAMENADKHVCPFSIPLVNRLIRMYSNPGEIVLDPFNGIGTVTKEAIELGRYAIGLELKSEYFEQSIKVCKQAAKAIPQIEMEL